MDADPTGIALPATDRSAGPASAYQAPELTVVIPTFNERDNVDPLLAKLRTALAGIEWEAIFVDDDSPDGTAARVIERARTDSRIRCLRRIDRRGLSSACIDGVLASAAPYFAVIDADMQHDETLLPDMLRQIRADGLDIVIGSRYVAGGGTGEWSGHRIAISRFANALSRLVTRVRLTDPMSGFFLMRREAFDRAAPSLSGQGFKILLDLFASSPKPLTFAELPYTFRSRTFGESKLDAQVVWDFLMLLLDKTVGRFVPVRFALFAAVGGIGVLVHLAVLAASLAIGFGFAVSQTTAMLVSMTGNFLLNNLITFRDRRLKGRAVIRGLLSFYLVCSVGAVANVGVATMIYEGDVIWWAAGIAGAVVGAVWNYAASTIFTWRTR
ncbi:glycosyltransferase family 2 protein [Fodinicurvata sp. EGI_FJ10296]|uniref:glycosyltransferase family 2 protein n=1 Tax=Fodinicurvata sp. EGI_FJ10296 TaxID=3231908 RepID=UPI00345261E1